MGMSDYKNYSLEQLENWIHDALCCDEITPQEIYDTIRKIVAEDYYYYKNHTSRAYDLLCKLNGTVQFNLSDNMPPWGHSDLEAVIAERKYYDGVSNPLSCDKDDKSPECKKAWTSFWEDSYDTELSEQYTEEDLNAMCDKAASDEEKNQCREYNLREAEYYNKRAELDANSGPYQKYIGWKNLSESQFNEMFPNREKFKNEISRNDPNRIDYKDGYIYESPDSGKTVYARKPGETQRTLIKEEKVKKWILPVQQSVIDGTDDYYVNFPDDLLKAANLKEGDTVEWVNQGDGSYLLRKVSVSWHPV